MASSKLSAEKTVFFPAHGELLNHSLAVGKDSARARNSPGIRIKLPPITIESHAIEGWQLLLEYFSLHSLARKVGISQEKLVV